MNPVQDAALNCIQVSHQFAGQAGQVIALAGVSFSVAAGEFVCIVGPSGCGKTTLLKMIAGLGQPSAGQILIPQPAKNTPKTAMVFQEQALLPWLNLLDNAAFGLETRGVAKPARQTQAQNFLNAAGIGQFARHYPHQLSTGMRQRGAIARAFLSGAGMLLMDEPFSALDAQTRLLMQEELLRIWKDHRKTVVFVTHDIEEAVLLGDRVLVMSGRPGRIIEDIRVPLARPRGLQDRENPEVRQLAWHIWKVIETEARRMI
ncbi:MAG TPA: ABC transporter ATP-binding protein [Thermoflexales bacterium]|mgnify:CR=1 FL=1|nr:ABC transporter ATP-binding protein [Thermoflexales bacterium]HQW36306.1 ABC transporter ATP-binding protein [Thermoflexales bacterium]HQZ21801.1 ABC transporter ATP-binding protein [Thermoflexales bacterium]